MERDFKDNKIKIVSLFIIVFAIGLTFAITKINKNIQTEGIEFTKIIYRFNDSSVPPKYHRSYTIKIENENLNIVVDSYGDILKEGNYSLSETDLEKISQVLGGIKTKEKISSDLIDTCTGGTSIELSVYNNDEKLISGSISSCGGDNAGTLEGDLESLSKLLLELIPFSPSSLE